MLIIDESPKQNLHNQLSTYPALKEINREMGYYLPWLDKQLHDLVMFKSFVSRGMLSTKKMLELALGLREVGSDSYGWFGAQTIKKKGMPMITWPLK